MMDVEKFLTELRRSHKQGAFADYVKEHWHEAGAICEEHGIRLDDVNVMVADSKNDDDDFGVVKDIVIEELES